MNSILNLGKRRVSVGKQQAQTSSSDESLKDLAQGSLSNVLKKEREKLWETLDQKIAEIKEQLRLEAEKKKDNQYDFKEKEKELNEHLETMT